MANKKEVVEATVVSETSAPVVSPADSIAAQKANFTEQLDQVKKEMARHQQEFELLKTRGIKLEGALESLDILSKSLSAK